MNIKWGTINIFKPQSGLYDHKNWFFLPGLINCNMVWSSNVCTSQHVLCDLESSKNYWSLIFHCILHSGFGPFHQSQLSLILEKKNHCTLFYSISSRNDILARFTIERTLSVLGHSGMQRKLKFGIQHLFRSS